MSGARSERPVHALVGAFAAVLAAWLVLGAAAGAGSIRVEHVGVGAAEELATVDVGGQPYVGANELARLVNATRYWRADLRKLEVRNVEHVLTVTVDAPYVIVDGVAVRLSAPARLVAGEVHLPLDVFPLALSGRFLPKAAYDRARGRVVLFGERPTLGAPTLVTEGGRTRLSFPLSAPLDPALVSARRSRFIVEVPRGVLAAVPGDTLRGAGLLASARFRREPEALLIELGVAPAARSYRVRVPEGSSRLELEFARDVPDGFLTLTPEYGARPNRPLRVLVLDPGHGGPDSGYVAGRVREKDLALRLARVLRDRMRERNPDVQVLLTRDADASLAPELRVEAANRAHGDLYLSLHFDGVPGTTASGVIATVTPPLGFDVETEFGRGADDDGNSDDDRDEGGDSRGGEPLRSTGARPLVLVPWREAAGRFSSDSRGVAELLLAALQADGRSPARLRQARVLPLEGANMPAVMLDCGTLSNSRERARLVREAELRALADVLARALERYAGGGFWP